jgi:lipoyl(octanoyl) transferase
LKIIISEDFVDYQESQQELLLGQKTQEEFIWILQHKAVFTFGKSFESLEIPNFIQNIPCQRSDRGGKITLHNEGQIVVYFCLNIKKFFQKQRIDFNIDFIVLKMENLIIRVLKKFDIDSFTSSLGRGVFVKNANNQIEKIAFIGINFKGSFLLNGISINFNNNLEPFGYINSCDLTCGITSVEKIFREHGRLSQASNLDINLFIFDLKVAFLEEFLNNTHI